MEQRRVLTNSFSLESRGRNKIRNKDKPNGMKSAKNKKKKQRQSAPPPKISYV